MSLSGRSQGVAEVDGSRGTAGSDRDDITDQREIR